MNTDKKSSKNSWFLGELPEWFRRDLEENWNFYNAFLAKKDFKDKRMDFLLSISSLAGSVLLLILLSTNSYVVNALDKVFGLLGVVILVFAFVATIWLTTRCFFNIKDTWGEYQDGSSSLTRALKYDPILTEEFLSLHHAVQLLKQTAKEEDSYDF